MAFYPTASGGSPYARLAAMGGIGAGANGGGTGIQLGAPQYRATQFANPQSDAGPAFDPNNMWWGDPQGYKNYLGGERQKATAMQTYERLGGNGSGGPGSTSAQPWLDTSSPWYGNMAGYQANAQKSPWLDSTSQWYGNEAGFRASQAAATGGANVSAGQSQAQLEQLAHPGMVLYRGQWVYPAGASSPTAGPGTGIGR